ncbi:DoxX family membrane protein [bacterium]|nr:DoxX family membrane protein [bacterium]
MSEAVAPAEPLSSQQRGVPVSVALLLCRIVAGGAFILAGALKVKGGPLIFQMSIEGFKLVPAWATMPLAYFLPWLEILTGLALVLGIWTRQSALVVTGLYVVFTVGLASVLVRGLDIDCGCFGGLFGESSVGPMSLVRNGVFIVLSLACLILGGGRFALTADDTKPSGEVTS